MSTQAEVQVSYDVGNEFFRLWLDKRMNYTSAVFDGTDDLDEAQVKKLDFLYDYAHIEPGMTTLDIGCGWGANIEYLARDRGVQDVHGITLSPAQHDEITARKIPNVTTQVVSYLDYEPAKKFDAIESICMIEHVATPADARSGRHIDLYRNYFRLAHEWSNPGAYFALQAITRNRVPRNRKDARDIGWVTYEIFPGGISVRLEDICQAVNPYWEIMEMKSRRKDYQRTCEKWLEGLRSHEDHIRKTWSDKVFEDYDRYLDTCVRAFDRHYQTLSQWSLKRID